MHTQITHEIQNYHIHIQMEYKTDTCTYVRNTKYVLHSANSCTSMYVTSQYVQLQVFIAPAGAGSYEYERHQPPAGTGRILDGMQTSDDRHN